MLLNIAFFIAGLAILLGGGESLVRGASAVAQALGVPPVAIGLTVVAFGTSAPEFVVAVIGAISGAQGVAFGNLVGANIINIGLILGLTAVILPLSVNPTIVTREIPMLILAMSVVLVLSIDGYLGAGPNRLVRGDGVVLLLLFGVFLYYTAMALRRPIDDPFVNEARRLGWRLRAKSMLLPVILILAGLAGLTVGGNLLVDSAVEIAKRFGLSPAIIGLTIISIGTTMPELTTSLLAVRRGEPDLAVGNIVGSNIFNILFVLGVASAISPIDVPAVGPIVILVAILLSCLLFVFVITHQRNIVRTEGGILLLVFVIYLGWIITSSLPNSG